MWWMDIYRHGTDSDMFNITGNCKYISNWWPVATRQSCQNATATAKYVVYLHVAVMQIIAGTPRLDIYLTFCLSS